MKRKTAVLIISYLCAAVAALGALAYSGYQRAAVYERQSSAGYQHAFAELVTGMREIDTALQKSLYASDSTVAAGLYTEIFGKAMTAQMSLGAMPFSTVELEKTASFISRVGDYSFALARAAAGGDMGGETERENLRALSDTAELLALNLSQLQADMADGILTMDELTDGERRMDEAEEAELPSTVGQSVRLIEQEFPELPSLIYDGPFSEHISSAAPRMLEGERELSAEEALKAAADFLELRENRLTLTAESSGAMPCYYFSAAAKQGEMQIVVSKAGGYVVNLLCPRLVGEPTVDYKSALGVATRFLERRGYSDMAESYHMISDGAVTINFAYTQDGVICYPDLVKVTVALDTGTVTGFEALGYISCHTERELPEPEFTEEAARAAVPEELEIVSSRLCVVPSDGKFERLCWEYVCRSPEDRSFIIYVGAMSGRQEKILILLEDDNGTLTI